MRDNIIVKNDILEIINQNGEKHRYNVLFKFDELDNNEHYIVYTDYTKREDGYFNICAKAYNYNCGKVQLSEVKDLEVKKFIDEKIKSLVNG